MQHGALAIIDALGFKGIWKKYGHTEVIAKMNTMAAATEAHLDSSYGGAEIRAQLGTDPGTLLESVTATFLSDTVVLTTALKKQFTLKGLNAGGFASVTVALTSQSVETVMLVAVRPPDPALVFRGAISVGEFTVDKQFCVGPTVDEAAECHDLAQGAFVWVTPAGINALRGQEPFGMLKYAVPLRGGSSIETFVVSPFSRCNSEDECADVAERLLSSFASDAVDVLVKRQHTKRFLDYARGAWAPAPL